MGVVLTRLERAMRTIRCTGYKFASRTTTTIRSPSPIRTEMMRNGYGNGYYTLYVNDNNIAYGCDW
jgi:hypothetical protein